MTDLASGTTQIVSIAKGREDGDPQETAEWLDALDAVVTHVGKERAQYLFDRLSDHALSVGVESARARITPYRNTIGVGQQPPYPGNLDIEERLAAVLRWNALAMVVRANRAYGELGGHIASYASAADLFEVGFNHFFRATGADGHAATSVYFQPHRRLVSMRALIWKAFSTRSICATIVVRLRGRGCVRIRIRG